MAGFDGSVQCWVPDIPFTRNDEWRLNVAKFGDGYEQRVLDGINALDREWSLKWNNRTAAVITAMTTYLANLKAAGFLFKDPTTGLTYTVFCDSWSISWNLRRRGGDYYGTLDADFRKANGVAV